MKKLRQDFNICRVLVLLVMGVVPSMQAEAQKVTAGRNMCTIVLAPPLPWK